MSKNKHLFSAGYIDETEQYDTPYYHPSEVNDTTRKGEYQGLCNMSSCKTKNPATWYNHGSRKYYCPSCAHRLNSDEFNQRDAERLFGHDLCTEGEQKDD